MSFYPLQGGFNESLLGTAVSPRRFYMSRSRVRSEGGLPENSDESCEKGIRTSTNQSNEILDTIIAVFISAFIFVTLISIYDVIRNAINNYYASITLNDPRTNNKPQDILNTEIANEKGLISSAVFAIFCMISSIILISFLIFLWSQSKKY